jgi:hypothetical protein
MQPVIAATVLPAGTGRSLRTRKKRCRPSWNSHALTTVTTIKAGRWITDYTKPATPGGHSRSGILFTPTGNVVKINRTIMGKNDLRAEYAIGFTVRSKNVMVA